MKNDVVNICLQQGIVYVGNYINADNKFDCICACGRPWFTYLSTVRKGGRCGHCRGNSQKISTEVITSELGILGLKLLQPYKGNKTPIVYECSCGGIGKTSIDKLRLGRKCGNCIENSYREKFQSHGCEIINYFSASSILYVCQCGNTTETTADNWSSGSKKCSKCRLPWNHNPNAIYERKGLYAWKKAVLTRDNFTCVNCNSEEDLHVHHIEAFSIKPNLASEVDNGVTCCKECHISLHTKYGINVGLNNLLTEFNLIGV